MVMKKGLRTLLGVDETHIRNMGRAESRDRGRWEEHGGPHLRFCSVELSAPGCLLRAHCPETLTTALLNVFDFLSPTFFVYHLCLFLDHCVWPCSLEVPYQRLQEGEHVSPNCLSQAGVFFEAHMSFPRWEIRLKRSQVALASTRLNKGISVDPSFNSICDPALYKQYE